MPGKISKKQVAQVIWSDRYDRKLVTEAATTNVIRGGGDITNFQPHG